MRPLGKTGLLVPSVVFGTSSLGNLYRAYPEQTKLDILSEIVDSGAPPVVLDSAGKYGAGLALESIGAGLRARNVAPDDVLVSNKLGWMRVPLRGPEPTFESGVWFDLRHDAVQDISYEGILRCWRQGNELLGAPYAAQLVSVHDPDEYLARARGADERARAKQDIIEAYRALHDLKRAGSVRAIGIGAKDWRVIRELAEDIQLDWVMMACSLTVFHHPPDVVALAEDLHRRGVAILNSAVFHAGFLTGGKFFDYRAPDKANAADAPLFAWREKFAALCQHHDVTPAAVCVRFALSAPGVVAVALNTGRPEQVRQNVALADATIPPAFWLAAQEAGLIRRDYTHLELRTTS
ncbi:MAG: aldo/keto reductase [Deltaproteobacteria bacterium]|nr:aldo/keto reductase [Deltaproteobacteria bacterium]